MNPKTFLTPVILALLWAVNAPAYEVWMGTHLMRHADATNLAAWSTVARQLEGINVNRSPHDTDPASNDDWRTIFKQFPNARNWMTEFPRSAATRDPAKTNELARFSIEDHLQNIFGYESTFGYDLTILMFYDERGEFLGNEYLYEWTVPEVQIIRDWLDSHGRADVQLMWNVRNNSTRARDFAKHPLVDLVEIEASTTELLGNQHNQITFFEWFWGNSATKNKRIALQIPRSEDSINQYRGTRRVAKMLGETIGTGDDGMRSDRLIFLPVTYQDNYEYLPETVSNGTAYNNTLTSIALSLIEQRSLFEGRTRLPTTADADSTTRLFGPTVSLIADQVLPINTATGPLAFTIEDDLTSASALTLIKESSNTNLVPLANIVLGGSDSNRTVTVTPVTGQSGSAVIKIWVSDGTLATPVTFTFTSLPPGIVPGTLFSTGADCSIKEDPAIDKLTSATVDVGARGSSPWVESCTVYVFELPNLGAVANPFTAATFTFNFVSKGASSLRGYDLYGLGRRAGSNVLTGDFYSQTSTPDPTDATRLQQTIMNNSTPLGLVTTTDGGSANLLTYLNAQYAGGAGAGQYVFLRINSRDVKTGVSYATLTMSEGGLVGPPDTRPRISYQAMGNTAPTVSPVADQTIFGNTNTGPLAFLVGDDSTAPGSLTLAKLSSNTNLVPLANIVFGGSDANRTVTVTPAGQSGSALISIIVSDGSLSTTNSFTLTVWPPGTVVGFVTNNTPGTVMWPCPPGVTNIQVECWGGGGAGGSSATTGAAAVYVAGGGGAGGAYARKAFVPVTPGNTYSMTIGMAAVAANPATASNGARVNGADVSFAGDGGVIVLAKGGQGGASVINPTVTTGGSGGEGSTTGCLGDGAGAVFAGGTGYGFAALTKGGSGGGGAGNGNSGSDAVADVNVADGSLPGAGGVTGGGAGGQGANAVGNGGNASDVGGGGGGARTGKFTATSGADLQKSGGTGGLGQIILTYVQIPTAEPPMLGHSLNGGNLVLSWSGSGFKVQSCTNLTSGVWSDVPGGSISPVNITPTLPAAYYRLTQQ